MRAKTLLAAAVLAASLFVSCADKATVEDFVTYAEETGFVKNPQAILDFFYQIVCKRSHQNNELHPAWRVM